MDKEKEYIADILKVLSDIFGKASELINKEE